ncbi:hypothetical protein BP5796_12691 [Coleophoma crateriformis]|uniref:Uncharacterized protein n=1 Tax=Coleophoma crateriformis TaxID=565419 RepID=A0A3D8Q601_9HELO|nr:hypothetical protein BP5796_12691 [Coleophoma crateriformis]
MAANISATRTSSQNGQLASSRESVAQNALSARPIYLEGNEGQNGGRNGGQLMRVDQDFAAVFAAGMAHRATFAPPSNLEGNEGRNGGPVIRVDQAFVAGTARQNNGVSGQVVGPAPNVNATRVEAQGQGIQNNGYVGPGESQAFWSPGNPSDQRDKR